MHRPRPFMSELAWPCATIPIKVRFITDPRSLPSLAVLPEPPLRPYLLWPIWLAIACVVGNPKPEFPKDFIRAVANLLLEHMTRVEDAVFASHAEDLEHEFLKFFNRDSVVFMVSTVKIQPSADNINKESSLL